MLYAREKKITFENFEARCPACETWLIFNRASDFGGARKIAFREVNCLKCGVAFAINGDSADAKYAALLFSVFELIERREYARSITTITQSYEAFFFHALREVLAKKHLIHDLKARNLDAVKSNLQLLREISRTWAYRQMRNAFIHVALEPKPKSVTDAKAIIDRLPTFRNDPTDDSITNQAIDADLSDLLLRLKRSRIDEERNRTAHKHAFLPTEALANDLFDEARTVVWGLARLLDVRHDSF